MAKELYNRHNTEARQAAGFDDLVTTRNVTLFSCSAGEVGPQWAIRR